MKLKSIYIKGFKDPEREINLEFSDEPITVIYGVNGSGKTTLLRVISGILSRDSRILEKENVERVKLRYEQEGKDFECIVSRKNEGFSWSEEADLFNDSTSILFGTDRGVMKYPIMEEEFRSAFRKIMDDVLNVATYYSDECSFFEKDIYNAIDDYFGHKTDPDYTERKRREMSKTVRKKISPHDFYPFEGNHIYANLIKITDITQLIVKQYSKGKELALNKINQAFFETIENAFSLEENGDKELILPDDFEDRLLAQRDFVETALLEQKNTAITRRLQKYLTSGDRSTLNGSKILKSLLINILENAEEPNLALEATTKLIEIFNNHLHYGKQLIVTSENAYIQLKNGGSHLLRDLSSGERHLLTLLTLFLVAGRNRNFFFIDEPEISLNIKWQRKLLPLLSELNPNAQIIAVSHIPAIANRNTRYLKELI